MRPILRSGSLVAGCIMALSIAACGAKTPGNRPIQGNTLPGCALDEAAKVELTALDDRPLGAGSFAVVSPNATEDLTGFPSDTQLVLARLTRADDTAVGLGVLAPLPDGQLVGPIFRTDRGCQLSLAGFPAVSGPAYGRSSRGVLLAGGHDAGGRPRADAIWIDATTAVPTRLKEGLSHVRDRASVLPLDRAFVIAGGVGLDGKIWQDFEPFDPTSVPLHFEHSGLPPLGQPRADAGSIVLANGDGLLVGGFNDGRALDSMERIDAATLESRVVDLAALRSRRRAPIVVRIATGEVLVMGGIGDDGAPVPDVEVFSSDAKSALGVVPLTARLWLDAVALPSGAVLVARGAPGAALELSLVRLDGVESVGILESGGSPPRFVEMSEGAPLLFDGRVRHFAPWTVTWDDAPSNLSTLTASSDVRPFMLSLGVVVVPQLADSTLTFAATRTDLRTALAVDEPLGLGSTSHLVPDRLSGFVPSREGLQFPPNGRVAIADATYAAFTLRLGGAGGRDLPDVELRTPRGLLVARIGIGGCAWPAVSSSVGATELRRDAHGIITLSAGDLTKTCAPLIVDDPLERVSLILVASASGAKVQGITVIRG